MTGREREQILDLLAGGGDFRFEAGRRIRFERRGRLLRVSGPQRPRVDTAPVRCTDSRRTRSNDTDGRARTSSDASKRERIAARIGEVARTLDETSATSPLVAPVDPQGRRLLRGRPRRASMPGPVRPASIINVRRAEGADEILQIDFATGFAVARQGPSCS